MEREEGELTDEDLEDVSDNSSELSIAPIALAGKSPSREPFRELSLTSISDDSDTLLLEKTTNYRHISRDLYRKHSHKHQQQHRRGGTDDKQHTKQRARKISEKRNHRKDYSSVSSSSDDSNYKEKTIHRQLRNAVRIDQSQNLPNCSLRTRLKRMIEPHSHSSQHLDEDNIETLRVQALQSKTKNELNPNKNAENNVVNDEDIAQLRLIALKSAVIKKHAERRKRKEEQLKQQEQQMNAVEKTKTETPANNSQTIEEDEDILRAMLLTSISKKIADTKNIKPVASKQLNKLPTNPTTTTTTTTNRFIINVNSDSETDSEQNDKKTPKIKNQKTNDIFDKNLSLFLQQARAKTEAEKSKHQSDISHLPRSQQIEYKRLKRKLQILTTRGKPMKQIKKNAGDENNFNKKINNLTKPPVVMFNNNSSLAAGKDERLLIKGKYEELTPLMSRVSEARIERDKTQAEVKRLINNLKIARAQLTASHQEYTMLVQQLVKAKTDIDKRANNHEKKDKLITSTPNKLIIKENNCLKKNTTIVQEQVQVQETTTTTTTTTPPPPPSSPAALPIPLENLNVNVNENEINMTTMPIPISIPIPPEMMEIVENDEDENENVPELIVVKKEATILKYHSPLEHIQLERKQPLSNPLLELCPYDLLGVCRDPDCSYQHCGNN